MLALLGRDNDGTVLKSGGQTGGNVFVSLKAVWLMQWQLRATQRQAGSECFLGRKKYGATM